MAKKSAAPVCITTKKRDKNIVIKKLMAIAVAREKRNEKKNEQKKSHAETRKAIQQSMHCIE